MKGMRYVSYSKKRDEWAICRTKAGAIRWMKEGEGSDKEVGDTICDLPEYVRLRASKTKVTTVKFS